MSALMHRAASPAVLLNPLRWYPMAHGRRRRGDRRRRAPTSGIWRGWRGRCTATVTTTTVPIGEFTGSDSGSVVVWDSDAAGRLFHALATDSPVPQDVLDAAKPG